MEKKKKTFALRMISGHGDDTLATWDETTSQERLAEIEKEFNAKVAEGYFGANVDVETITNRFDPKANMLLIPRIQGGFGSL